MRRSLVPAVLALVLVPLTAAGVLRLMAEPPPSALPFLKPTHRLAVAVDGAMRAAMTGVKSTSNKVFMTAPAVPTGPGPGGKAGPSEADPLPEDSDAFWVRYPGAPTANLMHLREMTFEATARDGRAVKATVKADPFDEGSVVDFHGDAEAARTLAGPIAAILARPAHPHDSIEDRAALAAFFIPVVGKAPGPLSRIAGPAPARVVDPAVEPAGAGSDDVPAAPEPPR